MIAKFVAVLCLLGAVRASASGWAGLGYSSGYASGLGYASDIGYGHGYSGYAAPAYTTPLITKAVVAAPIVTKVPISYAPAISSVSRYQVHSTPIVKSYVTPALSYGSYASPYSVSYGQDLSGYGYAGHGYGGYGYGGYGYGSKYLW